MDTNGELDRYFLEREQHHTYSGVVRIVQSEQEVYTGVYGYASRSWRIPNTLDMRFNTASITKLFTSVAVLQLIDRGLLGFDTRAVPFLELHDTAIDQDVNVYHLLTHTSGIGDDADEEAGESYEDLWKAKPNYAVTETADFLPQFVHKPPNFAPGQGCRYCNCSYILLGLMVEKVAGTPYRDYVRQHIFAPAGMARSEFFRLDQVHEDVAEGADPIVDGHGAIAGWKTNIYSFPPIGTPDGGAYVTAGDLDRFLRAVQAEKLLSPRLSEAFLTPQVHYRDRSGWNMMYGYGLWFWVDKAGRVVCYQKEGVAAGVSGLIRYYPAPDLSVVLLSNMQDGVWEPIRTIHELVLAGKLGS